MPGLLVVIGLLSASGLVAAQSAPPRQDAPAPGWFLPVGLNVGAASGQDGWGLALGGEASLAWLFGTAWLGGYADGLYDFGAGAARASAGVEVGWFAWGLEAGWVAGFGDGLEHGGRVGALLTSGLTSGYVRWVRWWAAGEDVLELGVLLKWPFRLQRDR